MNLLVTGAWQSAAEYLPALSRQGHEICFMQQEKDALPCDPGWVEGIIGNGIFLSHAIESFPRLRYIQLTSAGYDRVSRDYVKSRGITIRNARGVYSAPMAEMALAGVLYLFKGMKGFCASQENHRWEKQRELRELTGKNVAIVGCGSVGTECAGRFRAFGCRIIGVDPFGRKEDSCDAMRDMAELDPVLEEADIVIVAAPLTEETKGLLDSRRLSHMKDGAVLVNIARGALVETRALIKELGRISAVLDVFEEEPLPEDSPLWDYENVVITPHNSFVGEGNGRRMGELILKNLMEYGG